MYIGVVTVVLVDLFLFVLIRLVHSLWVQKKASVPVLLAVVLFAMSCGAHFAATHTLGQVVKNQQEALIAVLISAAFGCVPIWAYVHMLCSRISEETHKRRTQVFPRAHKLRVEGNIEGALREYLKYFEETPNNPAPLFSAAGMLEQEREYRKAATLFRQIMDNFESNLMVWARAAYRLADLRETRLADPQAAKSLRSTIETRVPPEIRREFERKELQVE